MTLIAFCEVGRLAVTAELRGKHQTFSFDSWPLPGLTRQLAAIFANAVASDGWVLGIHGATHLHHCARQFVRHLHGVEPEAESLRVASLAPEQIDRYDAALHERYGNGQTHRRYLGDVLRMLREADLRANEERDDEVDASEPVPALAAMRLSSPMQQRVQWISRFDEGQRRPLDAYPPTVAAMLREAADKDIDEVVQRISVVGADMVAKGRAPVRAWGPLLRASDLVWLIDAEGPLTQAAVRTRFGYPDHIRISTLNRYVFPDARDLLPFLIRLSLDTGIPIESLTTLSADCLRNPDQGRVTIRYLKRRAGGWQAKVVRDSHPLSPGGLIRTVLALTRRAREITGSDRLWVGLIGHTRLGEPQFKHHGAKQLGVVQRFVRDHDLRHGVPTEDGTPPYLELQLRRLRKTHKVERIRATRGRVRDWADDHSIRVAVNHYGDVPELRGEHEAAVEAALTEALAVTRHDDTAPSVTGNQAEEEQPVRVEPTVTSVPGVDLWVGTCRDPYDSPAGRKGQLCPVAFFGCLRCTNATVHVGKLPGIIQYLNHIVSQRERMDATEWAAVHRDTYHRIVTQILPLFSEADLAKARTVAESDQRLVFLPPNLSTMEIS